MRVVWVQHVVSKQVAGGPVPLQKVTEEAARACSSSSSRGSCAPVNLSYLDAPITARSLQEV